MLETASLPILIKAVDFLFDECKKIMDERRERRKPSKAEPSKPAPAETAPQAGVIQTKEAALRLPIRPETWTQTEKQVNHLMKLLEIHQGNQRLLRMQAAQWGDALVPPIIVNSLGSEETKILEIAGELQTLLSEVYAQKVQAIKPEDLDPQI
jgi:hypothetical protein